MDVGTKIKELEHQLEELKRDYSTEVFNKNRQKKAEILKNFTHVVYNDHEPKPVDLAKELTHREIDVGIDKKTGLFVLCTDYGTGGSSGTLITAPNDTFHKVHVLFQTVNRQVSDVVRATDSSKTFEEKWALIMESQTQWNEILKNK